MMFGAWGDNDLDACCRMLDRAVDLGINFVDTADVYAAGGSEEMLGRAMVRHRDDLVIATKFFHPMGVGVNQRGTSRRWIRQAVEGSLSRLGTDRIDLYQVHSFDTTGDVAELIDALDDLVREGKVLYVGTSNWPAHEIVGAQWIAAQRGARRFVCEQAHYSLLSRRIETDVLPVAKRHALGIAVWSPLAGGLLSGGASTAGSSAPSHRERLRADRGETPLDPQHIKVRTARLLADLARIHDVHPAHLAVAFVLNHPAVTTAVIGPRTLGHLESIVEAADLHLSADLLDAIDRIVPPGTSADPHEVAADEAAGLACSRRRRL